MKIKKLVRIIYGVMLFVGMIAVTYSFSSDTTKTILFDEGHGQLFKVDDTGTLGLSSLSAIFLDDGWFVRTSSKEITDEHLTGVDALVISGAFRSYTRSEIKTIMRFIDRGGKMSVMLHIGPPVSELLNALDVSVSNGVLHEEGSLVLENDIDFKVDDLIAHTLTSNLTDFAIYGGWALLPNKQSTYTVAQTSKKAWIDLNRDNKADAQQQFATVVVGTLGSGEYVIFSDDAMFQNNFLKGNNLLLAKNLARWLAE